MKGIEQEHQKVIDQKHQEQASLWEERRKVFEVDDSDPTYEKVQKIIGKFKLGEDLTPEQIEVNNNLYSTYAEIDYFGKPKPQLGNDRHPKGSPPKKQYNDPFSNLEE